MSFTAKSIIFDIADNWGDTSVGLGIRAIDFWYGGSKITVTSGFTAYGNSYSTSFLPAFAFNTSLSKTGGGTSTQWQTASGKYTNIRLIVVFDTPIQFDQIRINNFHSSGSMTTRGAKNTKIQFTAETETDTTYNAIVTGGIVIWQDVVTQHPASDTESEQTLTLGIIETNILGGDYTCFPALECEIAGEFEYAPSFTAKSVVFDFTNIWGGDRGGIRAIDFIYRDVKIDIAAGDITCYTNSETASYEANKAFITSLSKIGSMSYTVWLAAAAKVTNMRVIVVFDTPQTFDQIRVNNFHNIGLTTNRGVKDTEVYASANTITDTVYDAAVSGGVLVWIGQLHQHVAANAVDEQTLYLINPNTTGDVETSFPALTSNLTAGALHGDIEVSFPMLECLIYKSYIEINTSFPVLESEIGAGASLNFEFPVINDCNIEFLLDTVDITLPVLTADIGADVFSFPGNLIDTLGALTMTGFIPRYREMEWSFPALTINFAATANFIRFTPRFPVLQSVFYTGANVTVDFPKLVSTGLGFNEILAHLRYSFPLLSVLGYTGGLSSFSFPKLSMSGEVSTSIYSSIAASMPGLRANITVTDISTVTLAWTLPGLILSGTIYHSDAGEINSILPALTAQMNGTPGIIAALEAFIPFFRKTRWTTLQSRTNAVNAELPAIVSKIAVFNSTETVLRYIRGQLR